ncbi:MAG: hypothetical protein Q8936_01590 [Bacillota bacterium]|nr:hypothetical protein [Bacillota bacterium]
MRSLKLSEYFKVVKPRYVILRLIPDTSIRNYNSTAIARTINHLSKGLMQRISRDEKAWKVEAPSKCSFMIDLKKNEVNFYFLIPERYENLFREKITEVWPKVTIEVVESVAKFADESLKYQVYYKNEDPLSLNTDKRCNEPLGSILGVLDIMQEGDRVGIFYNFRPTSQKRWSNQCTATFKRAQKNEPLEKEVLTKGYFLKVLFMTIAEVIDGILEGITEAFEKEKTKINTLETAITSLLNPNQFQLSSHSTKKKESVVISTQIVVLSESADKNRMISNANSIAQSFYNLNEDNELIYNKLPAKNISYESYTLPATSNKMSVDECQNFLELPGRELLQRHKIIQKVDVLESPVPKELQTGVMCIGQVTYKGMSEKSYLSIDKEFKYLTLCLIGPTRAGKTTLIGNLSKDGIENNECTILFDFCGNCELSDEVTSSLKNKKVLNIDCSNFDMLQGLGYNEIIPSNNNPFEIYRCAKTKTSQLLTLVNSINSDESELRARMERYLEAAAVIVFIQDGPIKDAFQVLQDHILRRKYISSVPKELNENLIEYIQTLKELDEYSKATKDNPAELVGTRLSNVQGILNRVSKLKQNTYMELMLKKDCANNINLVDEMQKPQLICIRMPEVMFSTEQEKDIYCTYWLTKIWGALQVRKWNIPKSEDRVKVNVVFDELYQVPKCQDFLRLKLSQIAKFSCKPIISCHYLGQISLIRNELKAANSSYMLIAGCDKDNFKELKEELEPYTLEDLLNLKRYHSMNLIRYEGGWTKFISKLPPPIT